MMQVQEEELRSEPAKKRRKLQSPNDPEIEATENLGVSHKIIRSALTSLDRSVTPPLSRRSPQVLGNDAVQEIQPPKYEQSVHSLPELQHEEQKGRSAKIIPSPIQLTRIRDLPAPSNVDTVSLEDILSDPLIRECWQFNYLFNIDFLMSALDEDVRSLVSVKIVHGFWKREDPRRLNLEESARKYPNVKLITAHMPEPFGTHHSKMMILFRHDDTAQVVIHTANMIPQDWANLCQAVWRSTMLPLSTSRTLAEAEPPSLAPVGSGWRFKLDLSNYLKAYGTSRTKSLCDQLNKYDFSSVRASLVASVPTKVKSLKGSASSTDPPSWGWPRLKEILKSIAIPPSPSQGAPVVVTQVSSIATLGTNDTWLSSFLNILNTTAEQLRNGNTHNKKQKPTHRIIFPTTDTIRRSLDGYASGDSIHMKIQSSAQLKQVAYMKPMLCHWAGDSASSFPSRSSETSELREAGRRRAAPHIKTYIRFSDSGMKSIDWAMVTSANLSTQAWGTLPNKEDEVRICSYEIGVVVWPELFANSGNEVTDARSGGERDRSRRLGVARMVPVFEKDMPDEADLSVQEMVDVVIGFRMPYDVPLVPYEKGDVPWCATMNHQEPDWKGVIWEI